MLCFYVERNLQLIVSANSGLQLLLSRQFAAWRVKRTHNAALLKHLLPLTHINDNFSTLRLSACLYLSYLLHHHHHHHHHIIIIIIQFITPSPPPPPSSYHHHHHPIYYTITTTTIIISSSSSYLLHHHHQHHHHHIIIIIIIILFITPSPPPPSSYHHHHQTEWQGEARVFSGFNSEGVRFEPRQGQQLILTDVSRKFSQYLQGNAHTLGNLRLLLHGLHLICHHSCCLWTL